jgi:hypothetical protein
LCLGVDDDGDDYMTDEEKRLLQLLYDLPTRGPGDRFEIA